MCGIAGVVGPGVGNRLLLDRMTDSIIHRGPDGEGSLVTPDAMLGARRLAVIDVEGGDQPIFNEDGSVAVVFNGEVYNFAELRRDLEKRGHRFTTQSDTECIVHLYEEHGRRCVEHLRGMFAFAVWDLKARRLVLARDRVGKKPLYYRLDGARLWFASELKALIQDDSFRREVDPTALHHYLTFLYVPAPSSIYVGTNKLPPAHTLVFENGRISIERYWRLEYEPKARLSSADAVPAFLELLRDATAIRMVSERPMGAFLSGGIDSSLVVATMAGTQTEPVKTFSIGFDDDNFDERRFARMVADRFGTDHHEYVVEPAAADWLSTLTWQYDEPFADSSAIPSMHLARIASKEVTVALNGDGGDESFAGYLRYVATLFAGRVPAPRFAAWAALAALRRIDRDPPRGSTRALVQRGLGLKVTRPASRYAVTLRAFSHEAKLALYSPEMRAMNAGILSEQLVLDTLLDSNVPDPIDAMLHTDVENYLPGDLLVKMEARSPLLDHHLMEFAAHLPSELKLRRTGGRYTTKYLMKAASRGLLPDEVIDRRKMGFGVPMAAWLRDDLRDLTRDALTDRVARQRGFFDDREVRRLLDEHDRGADHSPRIWGLLQFELWCRAFLDRRASTAAAVAESLVPIQR